MVVAGGAGSTERYGFGGDESMLSSGFCSHLIRAKASSQVSETSLVGSWRCFWRVLRASGEAIAPKASAVGENMFRITSQMFGRFLDHLLRV